MEAGDLDLVMAGHAKAINMVESGAKEISEEVMIEALEFGHDAIRKAVETVEDFRKKCGKEKSVFAVSEEDKDLHKAVAALAKPHLAENPGSLREEGSRATSEEGRGGNPGRLGGEVSREGRGIEAVFEELDMAMMRKRVIEKGIRADGRGPTEIRPIWSEVECFLHARSGDLHAGQTQALAAVTLGSIEDQQKIDDMQGESSKRFMLHYNFPATRWEVRPPRGPGRRRSGTARLLSALCCPSFRPRTPSLTPFECYRHPRIQRLFSMATVCSGCLQ